MKKLWQNDHMKNDDFDNYRYSTKEIASYYDLTSRGLAYYEKQGVLKPDRDEGNGYRSYSLNDCYNLYHSKLYANAGFSLREISSLLKEDETGSVLASIKNEIEQQRKKIELQQIILEHMEKIKDRLNAYQTGGQSFAITMRPLMRRLYVRRFEESHPWGEEQSREFALWNQIIPVDTASLCYDAASVLNDEVKLNAGIGNIIREEDFVRFSLPESDRVESLPCVQCVETILQGDSNAIDKREWLNSTLQYMAEHHLRLCGDIVTSMLLVEGAENHRQRFDLAWFPYEAE